MTVQKRLLHLLAATVMLGVMAASAYAHSSSAHAHKSPVLSKNISEKLVSQLNENVGVTTLIAAKASRLREKTSSRTETVSVSLTPVAAFDDEASTEGAGCVRDHCACGPSTHGNPWCYTTNRGDCPNHQGLLCVWSN